MSRKPETLETVDAIDIEEPNLKLRGQGLLPLRLHNIILRYEDAPTGSTLRQHILWDLHDELSGQEDDQFQKEWEALTKEFNAWKSDFPLTLHKQRREFRALRRLMFRQDLDGPKDIVDEQPF